MARNQQDPTTDGRAGQRGKSGGLDLACKELMDSSNVQRELGHSASANNRENIVIAASSPARGSPDLKKRN